MTAKEYFNYYGDCFGALLRKAFNKKEILVFLSYQPEKITSDYNQVKADTKLLFAKYTYVETIERNFVRRRMYNDGDYADGFHSHLIMRESDYLKIEKELTGVINIDGRVVYDLEELTEKYLAKQTIDMYPRLLPTLNKSPLVIEVIETIQEKVITPLKRKIILFNNTVSKAITKIKRFIILPLLKLNNMVKILIRVNDTT